MDQKNNNDNHQKTDKTHYMPIGMCLGVSIGMSIGLLMDNLPVGMCIGLCFGTCVGIIIDSVNNKKHKDEANSGEEE